VWSLHADGLVSDSSHWLRCLYLQHRHPFWTNLAELEFVDVSLQPRRKLGWHPPTRHTCEVQRSRTRDVDQLRWRLPDWRALGYLGDHLLRPPDLRHRLVVLQPAYSLCACFLVRWFSQDFPLGGECEHGWSRRCAHLGHRCYQHGTSLGRWRRSHCLGVAGEHPVTRKRRRLRRRC